MKVTGTKTTTTRIKKPKKTNNGPDFITALVASMFGVEITREYKFLADRGFLFDYAITYSQKDKRPLKIALEKEGGIWMKGGGAHSRPANILRDMEKYTLAGVEGWVIIRRTPKQLTRKNIAETLRLIQLAISNYKS